MYFCLLVLQQAAAPECSEELLRILQNTPGMTWTARMPKKCTSAASDERDSGFGPGGGDSPQEEPVVPTKGLASPEDESTGEDIRMFDWRILRPDCFPERALIDTNLCESPWGLMAAGQLGINRCISGLDETRQIYSAQYLTACDFIQIGCVGGSMSTVQDFVQKRGTTTAECQAYIASTTGDEGPCKPKCDDGSTPVFTKSTGYFEVCKDLDLAYTALANGVVFTQFKVYADFPAYINGIYHHVSGEYKFRMYVLLIGYGNEQNTDYWIAQHAWGVEHGEAGYMRVKRGVNECLIEDWCFAMFVV